MIKLITAVIKPHRLDAVRAALLAAGVQGMTVTPAEGMGRQHGRRAVYRGTEYPGQLVPKMRVEVLVDLFEAEELLVRIAAAARTGSIGDGKAWITDVEQVVRIRTGEVGVDAL